MNIKSAFALVAVGLSTLGGCSGQPEISPEQAIQNIFLEDARAWCEAEGALSEPNCVRWTAELIRVFHPDTPMPRLEFEDGLAARRHCSTLGLSGINVEMTGCVQAAERRISTNRRQVTLAQQDAFCSAAGIPLSHPQATLCRNIGESRQPMRLQLLSASIRAASLCRQNGTSWGSTGFVQCVTAFVQADNFGAPREQTCIFSGNIISCF